MKTYRRSRYNDLWHLSKRCSRWPDGDYEEITIKTIPGFGQFCPECSARQEMPDQIENDRLEAGEINQ
jgi:hypothetical protein